MRIELPHRRGAARRQRRDRPLTVAEHRRGYDAPASFTARLPWVDVAEDGVTLLLEDGLSVAAVLELDPVPVEARPAAYRDQIAERLHSALIHALPEENPPWVLQCYLQREPVARTWLPKLADYVAPALRETAFTRETLQQLSDHLQRLGRPEGYFHDEVVSGERWRAALHTVRAVLYRRLHRYWRSPLGLTPREELNLALERLRGALNVAGVASRRVDHSDFLAWLARWFNPQPALPAADVERLTDWLRLPLDHAERPFGADLAERLLLGTPRSDPSAGVWWFDDVAHTVSTVQRLLKAPTVGHLTAERAFNDKRASLWDRFPEHAVLAMTLVACPQDQLLDQIERFEGRAVGASAEAKRARADYARARAEIARGNKLYPASLAVYLRAADLTRLRQCEDPLNGLLVAEGLQPVSRDFDPIRCDAYLRHLPGNYDPRADRHGHATRLHYTEHLARLLPLYGRSRGTGRPGFLAFNRAGEPYTADPLNPRDRSKNAHLLLIGPTGSGKSALLLNTLAQLLAIHRPTIFLTEVGRSFELFGAHLQRLGLTVNRLTLTPADDVSFPLFHDALALTDADLAEAERADDDWPDAPPANDTLAARDVLAEMELAASLMVTGGEAQEIARLRRADRRLLQRALIGAGASARAAGRPTVLTADVARSLRALDDLEGTRRERARELADCLELYTAGFAGRVFNRPGTVWPEADVTILNLGVFANEGHEDKLALSVIGLVNHVNARAETQRSDERQTILCFDEAHLVTTHPLLAPYLTKASKVWGRRYAVWLWLATQNLGDFPAGAQRILGMIEWWIGLYMPTEEIDQLARFRDLTDEQRALLQAVRKAPRRYTEGVLMHDDEVALFRNVIPPVMLALAGTDKDERAARARIMREHGCSELDAAYRMAETMIRELDQQVAGRAAAPGQPDGGGR